MSSLEIATVVNQDDTIFQDRNAVQSSTSVTAVSQAPHAVNP